MTLLGAGPVLAAVPAQGAPLRVDWATYNPVSLVLRQQELLEAEFARDATAVGVGCAVTSARRGGSSG